MSQTTVPENIQDIISIQEKKNYKLRIIAFIYLLFFLIVGLSATFWSIHAAKNANKFERQAFVHLIEIDSLKNEVKLEKQKITDLKNNLKDARSSSEYLRLGINNFHAKNYDLAVKNYSKAIQLDPENPVIYDLRGYSLYRNKKYKEAIESLQSSIKIDSLYSWGYYDLSLAYWANGNKDEAAQTIIKLLELYPGFKETINSDGQFIYIKKHPELLKLLN